MNDAGWLNDEAAETLIYTAEENGERLDSFIARMSGMSRSAAQRLMDGVTVNGNPAAKNCKLKAGDTVEVILPENEDCDAQPENIPLTFCAPAGIRGAVTSEAQSLNVSCR
ncbi:MAG: hypothetical protein IJX93_10465 [Clostridia bacterium]|nr:hypothetical protein [Clostridia bacterium]